MKNRVLSVIFVILVVFEHALMAQSLDRPFSKTLIVRTPVQLETDLAGLLVNQQAVSISYFDGLGRVEQAVQKQQTPNMKDFVQPFSYDGYGLLTRQYEPYASAATNGTFDAAALEHQYLFYLQASLVAHTQNAYSETVYENSPLLRPIRQSAPGYYWGLNSNHCPQNNYEFNTLSADGQIRKWKIRTDLLSCYSDGFYSEKELSVVDSKDENASGTSPGGHSRTYYNAEGKTVLVKSFKADNTVLYAYYVYDDYGQLIFIISPKAVAKMSLTNNWDTQLLTEDLVFRFRYDYKKRMIEKKVPGKQPEWFVYDELSRLKLSQDGNLRLQNRWNFFKYDIFGRTIVQGLVQDQTNVTLEAMQSIVDSYVNHTSTFDYETSDNTTGTNGYTNQSFPNVNSTVTPSKTLVVNYYDQYPSEVNTVRYAFRTQPLLGIAEPFLRINGNLTASKRLRMESGAESWMFSVSFFDSHGRTVEILNDNALGGLDAIFFDYDFEGKTEKLITNHNLVPPVNGAYQTIAITERFEYDHTGRMKNHYHQINQQAEILLENCKYNEIGQLVEKNLHKPLFSAAFLQSVDFTYNARGWLTNINRSDISKTNNAIFSMNEELMTTDQMVAGLTLDTVLMSFNVYPDPKRKGMRIVNASVSDKFWP